VETVADISEDVLRELAVTRPEQGRVLSLYLDLDPAEFATADARASAVTSLLDGAAREIESIEDLTHDERQGLRDDVDRARDFLESIVPSDEDSADGARALALFCCSPAGLFRPLRLKHSVETGARIAERPWLQPLAAASAADWCVLLINRRIARVFLGGCDSLQELAKLEDHVHGQHQQGGWSQARYERSVDKDVKDHFAHVGEVLRREVAPRSFRHLLIGGPEEIRGDVEDKLHPDLRDRLAGHFRVDVENSNADDLLQAAAPSMEEAERRRIDERVDRLRQGAAHGTGATGLDDVLAALNARAVETLMVQRGYGAAGQECPRCALLTTADAAPECPADGTSLERRDDVIEPALSLALEQSAEVLSFPDDRDDLRPIGEIAAVLRFAPA
jgi:peptide subunit release factor 1 (eRF1)